MGWSDLQTRQQAAVFAALGHDATWEGIDDPVRVVIRDEDRVLGQTIADAVIVRVRQAEVEAPADEDIVVLDDGRRYQLIAPPLLDRKLVWQCEAQPLAPA